jgi:hypothetical protein
LRLDAIGTIVSAVENAIEQDVLIAYIAGYLTGISGSSAIGNLVPAVLAFIGGLNLYMFGAKADHRSLTIFSIFLFAIGRVGRQTQVFPKGLYAQFLRR